MKKDNPIQQLIASLETSLDEKQVIDKRTCIVANHTVTIPCYHMSVTPLKQVNYTCDTNLNSNTLLEIEESPFLSIEQPNMMIIPVLQKLELRIPDEFMAMLWNPGGQAIILKRNTTFGYAKEFRLCTKILPQPTKNIGEATKKPHLTQNFDTVKEVTEISHDKLPPLPEKSAFMFHHSFYFRPKIDLDDVKISKETKQKLQGLNRTMTT